MVYSVTEYVFPPYCSSLINGSPTALCLVWWVMVYATSPISHSLAICSMICVFPIPGGPINRTGRCLTAGILYSPNASLLRYACTVCLISSFACLMFMFSPCLLCQNILLFHPESYCPRWNGTLIIIIQKQKCGLIFRPFLRINALAIRKI